MLKLIIIVFNNCQHTANVRENEKNNLIFIIVYYKFTLLNKHDCEQKKTGS